MSSITLSRTHQKKSKPGPTFHAISSDAIKTHATTKKHPKLGKSRDPSDHLNELQVVNKSILKQVSQFENECKTEMTKIRHIDEQNEMLAKPMAPKKQHVMDQMATLRTQVENQRTELERKERDCKDEVKKLARALKNVQNKYITLQIKYQNLAKKAVQNQKKFTNMTRTRKDFIKYIESLRSENRLLENQLTLTHVLENKIQTNFNERLGIREETLTIAKNNINSKWTPPPGAIPINWPPEDHPENRQLTTIVEENCVATDKEIDVKDLVKDLQSELRGHFEDIIVALMLEPVEFQAKELRRAISGLGTDELSIVEILGVHDNEDVVAISNTYEGLYQTSLESDIKGDTSGTLKRLLVGLSTGRRDESCDVNEEAAFKDAQALLQAGELLFAGTEESVFNSVLCQRARCQLRLIFDVYNDLVGHPIEKAIKNEFSGSAKDAMLQLTECVRDRTGYLATRLHDAMAGIGTDDRTLIRIIVSRSEKDLEDIKEAYFEKYGKSLAERIADDTSGDYKKALISIVG